MTDAAAGDATALVGVTGGAGTTRSTVELGATLAGDGRGVAVLDAAFATQGLGDYLDGRVAPDLTTLLTDERDAPLASGLHDVPIDVVDGRLACCPAVAPFERVARAKSTAAARIFESRLDEAKNAFDHVLVDTPPVAANQSVAAVNAVDHVVLVAPATPRGRDAVQRMRGRIEDVGADVDAVVATRGELSVADVAVPETVTAVAAAPTSLESRPMATAVAGIADAVLDVAPTPDEGHGFLDSVGEFVSR